MTKPNYYSIIPAEVRYDGRLTADEKLLYSEITAFLNMNGKCFASNSYFAGLYGVTKETISRRISKLKELGYIHVNIVYRDGTNEIINRYLQIRQGGIDGIINRGIDGNVKDNNTSISTTSINNNTPIVPLKNEEVEIYPTFEDFWNLYDKKVGPKDRVKKKFQKLRQKVKEEIMQHVVKYKEAQPDKRYRKNPETYLNQESWNDEIIHANPQSNGKSLGEKIGRWN